MSWRQSDKILREFFFVLETFWSEELELSGLLKSHHFTSSLWQFFFNLKLYPSKFQMSKTTWSRSEKNGTLLIHTRSSKNSIINQTGFSYTFVRSLTQKKDVLRSIFILRENISYFFIHRKCRKQSNFCSRASFQSRNKYNLKLKLKFSSSDPLLEMPLLTYQMSWNLEGD